MKYMLLFCGTVAEDEEFAALPPEEKEKMYKPAMEWFEANGSAVEGGYELQPASTATTVRKKRGIAPIVTDGPFAESGEIVGGYTVVDVDNLDAAIALGKSWPGGSVEIRPVVVR